MDPSLASACEQFEAMLLRPLLARLGWTRPSSEASGESTPAASDDVMGSMFADALAAAFARAGGIGVARELERSLTRPPQ